MCNLAENLSMQQPESSDQLINFSENINQDSEEQFTV